MHLVDDVNTVVSYLWGYPYLVDQQPDIIYRIVGSSIKLMDIIGAVGIEGSAGFTDVAGFMLRSQVTAIDGFGKNAGTGGLSDTPRSAEKIAMR